MKESLATSEFILFLQDLAKSKLVRVVGSYASGRQHQFSDIDLFVLRGSILPIIGIFDRHGVKWESVIVGHINSPRNMEYMPIPVECSTLFPKGSRTHDIDIFGVTFKAYDQ